MITKSVAVSGIVFDTNTDDGDDPGVANLPTYLEDLEISLPDDYDWGDVISAVCDALSDKYGYLVLDMEWRPK